MFPFPYFSIHIPLMPLSSNILFWESIAGVFRMPDLRDEVHGALGNNYRTQSSLTAINQAGTVSVGFSAVGGEQTPQGVAYTYGIRSRTAFGLEKDGGDPALEELKLVGSAVLAWAWDVDEAGNAVGTSLLDAQTAPIYPHAVEWPAESGEARLLPNLRGEEMPAEEAVSHARAISRNGRYVVGYDTQWVEQEGGGGYYNPRAVVWVKNRGATETTTTDINPWEVFDLNERVPEGWVFGGAHGISDEGIILVHGHRRMENGHWEPRAALLLPVEVVSDLNNNGKIDDGDRRLKSEGAKSDATDEQKEKATEYLFANDNLSNGLWDKDDSDSNKPQNHKDDDDVEELNLTCAATWGAVWFDHPAIDKLAFYKTKECKPADKVEFPFALSETNKLPETLYVRAEGAFTEQVDDDLVMKFGKADQSETWAEDKLKFSVVKHFGDKKFFEAARDYIMERNTKLFAHVKNYGSNKKIRMVVMREEAAIMKALDTYWQTPPLWGIDEVVNVASGSTAVINANFTFDIQSVRTFKNMTRRCHGRLVTGGVLNTDVSSDNDDPAVPPPPPNPHPLRGSVYAGPEAKYIAMQSPNSFAIAKGRVPIASPPQEALGGWHTDYSNPNQHVMVGIGKTKLNHRLIFTLHVTDGSGFTEQIAHDAKESGVPDLPSGNLGNLMLILGDAGTSEALAYRTANEQLKVRCLGKTEPKKSGKIVN